MSERITRLEASDTRPVSDPATHTRQGWRRGAAAVLLMAFGAAASAAVTDISSVPLSTTSTTTAKPNIMFILDDSGSMDWEYMPDEMDRDTRFGYYSPQCNGVSYNPAITYSPPPLVQNVSGNLVVSSYPNASYTAARFDGFNSSSGTANLTGSSWYRYTGTQPALSWKYAANGSVDTTTTFYTECQRSITNGSTVFTLVNMDTATADQKLNYANWYSYYRKRQLTMRTAAGRAFVDLSDAYRVGFTKISDTGITGSSFLNPSDFNVTQKVAFFNLLYGSTTGGSTPLRGSLSKVGRYYGMSVPGQSVDPVQYSCQRNYAVLSTDGYWNRDSETSDYRSQKLDGTQVGQQDGTDSRPMKDSASTTVTTRTTTTIPFRYTRTGTANLSTTFTRTKTTVTRRTGSGSNCGPRTQTVTEQRIDVAQASRILVEDIPSTTVHTVITTNGTTTSDSSSTTDGSATTISDTVGTPGATTPGSWATVPNTTNGNTCSNPTRTDITYSPSDAGSQAGGVATTWSGTPSSTSPVAGTTTEGTTVDTQSTGGDSNSLADIAEYYWKTDLRTSGDKSLNNVPAGGDDTATYQHMTTFTIGLGLKGTLTYDRAYRTRTTGDFADIKAGTKNWPVPSGTTGGNEDATHIDDLWHAAVNGRGQYFSASDPNQLDDAISTTLNSIKQVTESGAAASASTLTPVTGDDWVFLPSFTTVDWTGDLRAFKFTITGTGTLIAPDTAAGKEVWSAGSRLKSRLDARRVLFNGTGTLTPFTYANLTTAGLNGSFDNRCTRGTPADNLSQCATLTTVTLPKVTGTNLVSFLAGDSTLYLNANAEENRVFRTRATPLGDFVNASPVYVGKPPFRYADAAYAAFVSDKAARTKVVYAAANDGMLHAFKVGTGTDATSGTTDATGGTELWAFVPTAVMPEMWRLASEGYASSHRFYVDATPNASDVYDSAAGRWRTILVGGLGAGGRSYYALDVTDPESPALLWEFSDTNLGQTYGNPVITKDSAGTWVVAFTSGINNVSSGDGVGRLYIVNAITGAAMPLKGQISTGAGDATTPSNLGRLNAWIASDTDNTALRFYAGDMLGNLWRFDHDDRIAPAGREAMLLGKAQAADGTPQPITGKPVLTESTSVVGGTPTAIVSIGTGRLLNLGDLTNTTTQSVYSMKDTLGATGLGVLRSAGAQMVAQTLKSDRTINPVSVVDWNTKNGWYVDLTASSKERVHLDGVQLGSGVLAFASTVPTADACSQGGVSFLYQFDLSNGNVVGTTAFTDMIVGLNRVMSVNGKVSAIVTTQDQKTTLSEGGGGSSPPGTTLRRSSWRELTD